MRQVLTAMLAILAGGLAIDARAQADLSRGRGPSILVPLDRLTPLQTPSLARRHNLLDPLADIPRAGVVAHMTCEILRDPDSQHPAGVGRPSCHAPKLAATRPDLESAAREIAFGYWFDLTGWGSEANLKTNIDVQIARLTPLDLNPTGAEVLPTTAFELATRPSDRDAGRNYPDRAMRMNQTANVTMTCKVLPDYSLACVDPIVDPAELEDFKRAAFALSSMSSVKPLLRDGRSAAGKWVKFTLHFTLPM